MSSINPSRAWSDWYYTDSGPKQYEWVQRMEQCYSDTIQQNQVMWTEADADMRYVAGDQSYFADYYGNLPAFRNKKFYFNRIRRIVNMTSGHQRKNRKSIIAVGANQKSDGIADQITRMLFWAMNKCNAADMISEAFEHGSLTTGLSLLQVWNDYSVDAESGDLMLDHVPYNAFLIDPYFRKKDFSDCNFIWKRQYVSREAAKRLLPGRELDIDKMRDVGDRDGKFQFMSEAYNYNMSRLLAYDEYYYLDTRRATYVVDTEKGLSIEWRGDKDKLAEYLATFPMLAKRTADIPTVKTAIFLSGRLMYDGPNALGLDRFPFVPFLGYYLPEIPYLPWRCQGMVRGLRDAQFLYNRRRVIELDILESQVGSGLKYKPGSLVNPEDVFLTGQGRGVAIKDDAMMDDVQQIIPPQIPPSMIQLSELLGNEIQQISGVNEELLGSADDDKAGVLSMLRQGAGLTTLQSLFDNLDFSMKQLGEIFVEAMVAQWSTGKIERILQEEAAPELKAEPHHRYLGDYDIRIEEGINTTTQKQMQLVQLLHLKELGIPVPNKTIIEALTVQNKKQLIEDMEQEQAQMAQQAQAQAQAEIALLKAQVENLQAQAVANVGLGHERMARVEVDKQQAVERTAQAAAEIQKARLDQIKAAKELEGIDIDQIHKLVELVAILKAGNPITDELDQVDAVKEQEVASPLSQLNQSPQTTQL